MEFQIKESYFSTLVPTAYMFFFSFPNLTSVTNKNTDKSVTTQQTSHDNNSANVLGMQINQACPQTKNEAKQMENHTLNSQEVVAGSSINEAIFELAPTKPVHSVLRVL